MPTAFDVRALTSTVRIELDDTLSAGEQKTIKSQWADLVVEESDEPTTTIRGSVSAALADVRARAARSITLRTAAELADRITTEVTLSGIRPLQGKALMLHAAAVALDDGRVIGFVGPSGRGKTTASKALGRAYGYVTDETLAIRPDGSVVPYPKPLSIGARPGPKQPTPASGMGLRPVSGDGLQIAALVLLDRRSDVVQPYVESLSITEALPELVPHTSYLAAMHRPLRTLAERVRSTGGVRRVVYSEADSLPGLVDQILADVNTEAHTLSDVTSTYRRDCDCFAELLPDTPILAGVPTNGGYANSYWRTDHADALLVDDSLLVLRRHQVLVLEGVGPTAWLAASGSTEDEIREAVLRQLPAPPEGVDPAEAVARALKEMTSAQLLTRRRDGDGDGDGDGEIER